MIADGVWIKAYTLLCPAPFSESEDPIEHHSCPASSSCLDIQRLYSSTDNLFGWFKTSGEKQLF